MKEDTHRKTWKIQRLKLCTNQVLCTGYKIFVEYYQVLQEHNYTTKKAIEF